MKRLFITTLIGCSLLSMQVFSQTTDRPALEQQKRIALVIGNGNYLTGILANPENDARAMRIALEKVGFAVKEYENLNQSQMKRAIDDFGVALRNYDVGLFYYAGHGIQCNGYNYLIPVDAQLTFEKQVEYDCVPADRILGIMQESGAEVNIIVLDACRNNPFERSWSRTVSGSGLAFMNAPKGTLIAYATSPGSVASDGSGNNGLYTSAILENIETQNITILQMFQEIRNTVVAKSGSQQIPWESTSLTGDFYFNHPDFHFENRPVIGEIKEIIAFGSILLTTEIAGELYMDNMRIADVTSHTIIPIDRVSSGTHSLRIAGTDNWTQDITVEKGQTARAYAKKGAAPENVTAPERVSTAEHHPSEKIATAGVISTPEKGSTPVGMNEFIDGRDGKRYKMVKIGKKIWMAENLAYLPKVSPPTTESITAPHYYVYGYSGSNVEEARATRNYATLGVLYNWPAAMNGSGSSNSVPSRVQGVCPPGWHLPSDAEWNELSGALRHDHVGNKLKEAGTGHWLSPNANANNSTGFTGLPGGRRTPNGLFDQIGNHAYFWSATKAAHDDAWYRKLSYNEVILNFGNEARDIGFCVRCVKD